MAVQFNFIFHVPVDQLISNHKKCNKSELFIGINTLPHLSFKLIILVCLKNNTFLTKCKCLMMFYNRYFYKLLHS